jgi:hypothetical protein
LANPTTNYSWVLPTPTDLVTDLPADFDVALQGVDNTVKALNPETTLGDISYRSSTANTKTRLPIGTTGQVLTVAGGVPSWGTVSAGAYTQLATGTLSGNSVSITSISGSYKDLLLTMQDFYPATAEASLLIRVNSSSANYRNFYNRMIDSGYGAAAGSSSAEFFEIASMNNANDNNYLRAMFFDYADTTIFKRASGQDYYYLNNGGRLFAALEGLWRDTSAISSIQMTLSTGNFSGGSYTLYGVK